MALTPFQSFLLADTGISFGDEGKGRLVPELCHELREQTGQKDPVRLVLKVNGGANSGHTVAGLKLNLIPGGVANHEVPLLALGSGVVADPRKLAWETTYAESHGHPVRSRLRIDERTMVSDVTHRLLDLAWEDYRTRVMATEPRGSTGRGITPAYLDEVGQRQLYYADFRSNKDAFVQCLRERIRRTERTIQHVLEVGPETWSSFFDVLTQAEQRANRELIEGGHLTPEVLNFGRFRSDEPFRFHAEAIIEEYWEYGAAWTEQISDVRRDVLDALRDRKYVIAEFGQAYWLDKRHGFPPNVTASHTFTPELFLSAGIPAQPVHNLGVCKAYDTKVGTHTFLTKFPDGHPLGERLKKLEFGTSTGRQRMVGWCDCVEKGEALRHGGFQDLVINKLDVLHYDGPWQGGELLLATAYRAPDGTTYTSVPRDEAVRTTLVPVYRQLPGWSEDVSGVRHWKELPANARRYVTAIVKAIIDVATADGHELPALPNLRYVAVGPDPSQIIRDIPDTEDLLAEA